MSVFFQWKRGKCFLQDVMLQRRDFHPEALSSWTKNQSFRVWIPSETCTSHENNITPFYVTLINFFLVFIISSQNFSFTSWLRKILENDNKHRWVILFFKEMLKISVVNILSVRLAECSKICEGRFMMGIEPIWKLLS